jgi:hypothetical protein
VSSARYFVDRHHRHHKAPLSGLFAIAAAMDDGTAYCQCCGGLAGVVIAGRPVARMDDDDWTVEVTRLAVHSEARNAASFLYGAAWRPARALGYRRLVTFTLTSEPGSSLRAVGLRVVGETGGTTWSRTNRPRLDRADVGQSKFRWEMTS